MQIDQRKSVLVLEDDPQWQAIVSQLLKKIDGTMTIRCVPTTQEATRLLAEGASFDLIVADQFLEGHLTGLDFYRQLRSQQDRTSFVMLSGLGATEFSDLTLEDLDVPRFISKSKAMKTFGAVIRDEIQFPFEAPQLKSSKTEGVVLAILTATALAFTISQLAISESFEASREKSVNHFNTEKAPVLSGNSPVVRKPVPLPVIIKKDVTHPMVNSALRAEIQRIAHRADAITKQVSKQ